MILNVLVLQISMVSLMMAEEQKDHALFYRRSVKAKPKREEMSDKSVENVLTWLQSRYKELSRKAREDPSRAYLPSLTNPGQSPRPFQTKKPETAPTETNSFRQDHSTKGYQQEYSSQGYQGYEQSTKQGYRQEYEQTTRQQEYASSQADYQGYEQTTKQGYRQEYATSTNGSPETSKPYQSDDLFQTERQPEYNQQGAQQDFPSSTEYSGEKVPSQQDHLPHIHALKVDCSKDKMEVDLEFSSTFNGIVYSKGYHNSPECVYVQPNSNQIKYKFTLVENTCGTQFIDGFGRNEDSYLENTLVIQNEQGILEVWDAVRSVRCLWEGSIDQNIKTGLSIGSLSQELVTFSGDTGKAKIEIQAGRGPYGSNAPELVQIGDVMTLVVSVDGDVGFEVRIGECKGTDGTNSIELTDSKGCPLKEKLMAGFQYSRHQQTNAAIAYSYFRAFKFPDVMDLTIECNVQLCKTDCRPICDDPNQKFEPLRRRRSTNETDDLFIRRTIKVYLPEDIGSAAAITESSPEICLSRKAFYGSTGALSAVSIVSGLLALLFWAKNQQKSI